MKRSMIALVCFFSSTFALAAGAPARSLNDLPAKWAGVGGDLMTKVNATFEVEKINSVVREDREDSFSATYEVNATLALGERTVKISQITLQGYHQLPNLLEMVLQTTDELTGVLHAVVLYDEASNTYSLKEMPGYGMARRFVLQGK